jgi:hypothetical protein
MWELRMEEEKEHVFFTASVLKEKEKDDKEKQVADKHLDDFMRMFSELGMTEDRHNKIDSVLKAQALFLSGKKVADFVVHWDEKLSGNVAKRGRKMTKDSINAKVIPIQPTILMLITTFVVVFETVILLAQSVVKGVAGGLFLLIFNITFVKLLFEYLFLLQRVCFSDFVTTSPKLMIIRKS